MDFRNHHDFTLGLSEGINVVVGPNASGKTNCIEALQLLTTGESFRGSSPQPLIQDGQDKATIALYAEDNNRRLDISMSITASKKAVYINKNKSNLNQTYNAVPSILFSPDDLLLTKGSSSIRRNYFDAFGSKLHTQYLKALTNYKKALHQRNLLLKEVDINQPLLSSWTDYLTEAGSYLFNYRTSLLKKIIPEVQRQFLQITHSMTCDIAYTPSLQQCIHPLDNEEELTREQYKDELTQSLYKSQQEEIRRGQTLYGPHLDDISLFINNYDIKTYASQGQQRALALAIKIAELEVCSNVLGKQPILLLDDVMSELDEERRKNLFNVVHQGVQAVITTTHLSYFSAAELSNSNVVDIHGR